MNKLLKIALVLGIALARTLTAVESPPPLPVIPNRSPVDAPGTFARPLFTLWDMTSGTRDVLEMSNQPGNGIWMDIPGPYEIREIEGISTYYVPTPVGYAQAFFRVRREWGNPWI